MTDITLTVNGSKHHLSVDIRTTLLDLLRERLGLTGSKKAATKVNVAHAQFCSMANPCLVALLSR